MSEEKTIIEINGVKMEVDLRSAKRVDELKVGDPVKVLIKEYSDYKIHQGIIVGFDMFQELPTISLAYIESSYSETALKFKFFNSKTEGIEIVPANDDDLLSLEKDDVIKGMDREITKAELKVRELEAKKEYFLTKFGAFWQQIVDHETIGSDA